MDKNKIAIMTWHSYKNYGSVLQATALSKVIESLGYMPYMINYLPKGSIFNPIEYKYKIARKIFEKVTNKSSRPYSNLEQDALYENFVNTNLNYTQVCRSYPELYELNHKFNAFVCGSDQIWSPLCFDDKYFLSFVENTAKMVAYAPSIGATKIKIPYIRAEMRKLILRFDHLSVREKAGANIIGKLCKKKAQVVLDPTLLLDMNSWTNIIDASDTECLQLNNKYIVCYFLGESGKYNRQVSSIAKILGLPVYYIPVYEKEKNFGLKVPFTVGPREFVNLIKNASFVCTDSFHGLAFSINFNIPYIVFKRFKDGERQDQNSRIYNLLQLVDMKNRLYDGETIQKRYIYNCEFKNANIVLQNHREQSIKFLKNSLFAATNCPEDYKKKHKFKITDMCCGCGSCQAICPHNAIVIERNKNGFEHYKIDTSLCVQCGMCQKVCPFYNVKAPDISNSLGLFSYKSADSETLSISSSGGAAYDIANMLNQKDYLVCGSMYNSDKNCAQHVLIEAGKKEKLSLIQGSKYIQSSSAEAISQIGKLPTDTKLVFFGLPCQVAGVDKLLRQQKRREKVILVDLICHGVPSQLLWHKYLKEITMNNHISSHPNVQFRSVQTAWRNMTIYISDSKNIYAKHESKDDFYIFFRNGLCYMPTCYDCPYRERSAADIRLGDYWGSRFLKDKEGVSMMIAINEQGANLIHQLDGGKNLYNLKEYWTVQFPYNQLKPIFYNDIMRDLRNPNCTIAEMRRKYAYAYELKDQIGNLKRKLKYRMGIN